jgi:hypothetical protein
MRILFFAACLLIGAISAYYGQPLVHQNSDAIVIIITVMTVFAGFLVAIITILGDPALIPVGSWRVAENRRETIEAKLIVHIWLFIWYLAAIGLLFVGALITKAPDEIVSAAWKTWIERGYLFFGVTSFLFTLALPNALLKFQIGRIDNEIETRRRRDGISSDNDQN